MTPAAWLRWACVPAIVSLPALSALGSPGAPAVAAPGPSPAKALTQLNLDVWTTSSGLPQSTLTAVAQTRDGYVWVGTWSGLARFDGVRFSVYDKASAPGLRNSGIQTLLADPDGGLWIGTNGGGLSFYRDGGFTSYTTAEGLAGDIVRALHRDTRGRLWIGTSNGLSMLDAGTPTCNVATAQTESIPLPAGTHTSPSKFPQGYLIGPGQKSARRQRVLHHQDAEKDRSIALNDLTIVGVKLPGF